MTDPAGVARSALFAGLDVAALQLVCDRATARRFDPGETLCRAGDRADCCWVITAGLVDVIGPSGAAAAAEVLSRLRKGAAVGDVALILGEPHQETVVASIPTTALELGASELGELLQRFPQIVINALRTQHQRLTDAHARRSEQDLGETVAVATGESLRSVFPRLLATAQLVSPRSVTSLDREFSFAGALTAAFDLVSAHSTVLLPADLDAATVVALLREADRVVALVGNAEEAGQLGAIERGRDGDPDVEVVLVGEQAQAASREWRSAAPLRVIRSCPHGARLALREADLGWLARHVTRTKLGLALGAGGAKGYAHIGALRVLEQAGYVVDCVAGSSIGAIVATYIALGADAAGIDATLRSAFHPDAVAEIFKISFSGRSSGLDVMTGLLQETTTHATFADTKIPLAIMAVDLMERAPIPLREGALWQALLAATALAGFFRPYELDGHRFVDGLALVPVPTGAVVEDGADVTVAVNLIGRETMPSWPGGPPPEPPPERRRRGVLEDLLEVMDLSQLAESVRHTGLADVAITPRFGPGEWRDFHLADLFLEAGLAAAEAQLPALRSLALPAGKQDQIEPEGGGSDREDAVRV